MPELCYEGDFSPQDLKKALTFNAYFRNRFTLWMIGIIFVLGVVGLSIIHDGSFVSVVFVLAICYPFYYVISNQLRIQKAIKNKKNPGTIRQRIVLGEEQIICSRNGKFDHYEWSEVHSANESKLYFYLYMEAGKVLVLPKRDVTTEIAIHTRTRLSESLPHKKVHLRKDML